MKNDLSIEQLRQEVTVTLPLSAVLRLAEAEHTAAAPNAGRVHDLANLGNLPAIGAELNGGKFAGVTLENGKPALLVLLAGSFTGPHADALEWAKQQEGVLPSRVDGLVLLDNLKSDFKAEYYWLEPLRAGYPDYAWCQDFGCGNQGWNHRSGRCHACAVRRYPFQ